MLQNGWTWEHYVKWNKLGTNKKTNIVRFQLREISRTGKFTVIDDRLEILSGYGAEGNGNYYLTISEFLFWCNEKAWK